MIRTGLARTLAPDRGIDWAARGGAVAPETADQIMVIPLIIKIPVKTKNQQVFPRNPRLQSAQSAGTINSQTHVQLQRLRFWPFSKTEGVDLLATGTLFVLDFHW